MIADVVCVSPLVRLGGREDVGAVGAVFLHVEAESVLGLRYVEIPILQVVDLRVTDQQVQELGVNVGGRHGEGAPSAARLLPIEVFSSPVSHLNLHFSIAIFRNY